MGVRLTEVADGVHQLTTYIAEIDFSLNQYLVIGDEPLLFHTGMRQVFPLVSDAVSRVVPADDANPDYDAAGGDARERLQSARQQLAQYRRALDGGADPATVTRWITEAAEQERAAASDLQAATATAPPRLAVDDVLATIEELGSLAGVLSTAEPNDRAQFYEALGVAATYDATARTAVLEVALPRSANNVSEGRHKHEVHAPPGRPGSSQREVCALP